MQNTKKLIVGIAVLFVFVAYSLGMRHQTPVIAKPQSLENTNSTVSTSSTTPSSASSNTSTSTASTASSSTPAASTTTSNTTSGRYADGTFTGKSYDAYYGNVQVSVTITGGKISSVKFLQYPNTHSTSVYINNQAMPYLQQEAIQAQSANVQLISGATFTSQAFIQSLSSALSQA
jgi:uncharacterized protein with FMN-binding domain